MRLAAVFCGYYLHLYKIRSDDRFPLLCVHEVYYLCLPAVALVCIPEESIIVIWFASWREPLFVFEMAIIPGRRRILLNDGQALISCCWHTRHLSRFCRQKLAHNYTMTNPLWHQTDGLAEFCVWPEGGRVVACCLMLFYPYIHRGLLDAPLIFFALLLCNFVP